MNKELDSIIYLLQNTVIHTEESFEDELDVLIENLSIDKKSVIDPWITLSGNYSKLRYLYELINFYEIPKKDKFNECLKFFFIQIDKTNQYYLREINWEGDKRIQKECMEIELLLEKSLNLNDQIVKLKTIIDAYTIFVPLIEDFRKEKHIDYIEDVEFLQTFKKRKFENN